MLIELLSGVPPILLYQNGSGRSYPHFGVVAGMSGVHASRRHRAPGRHAPRRFERWTAAGLVVRQAP
jgi:hypothetical protein